MRPSVSPGSNNRCGGRPRYSSIGGCPLGKGSGGWNLINTNNITARILGQYATGTICGYELREPTLEVIAKKKSIGEVAIWHSTRIPVIHIKGSGPCPDRIKFNPNGC